MPVSARYDLRQPSYKPWKMGFIMEWTDPELQCHVHNAIIAATWHSLSISHFSQQIKKYAAHLLAYRLGCPCMGIQFLLFLWLLHNLLLRFSDQKDLSLTLLFLKSRWLLADCQFAHKVLWAWKTFIGLTNIKQFVSQTLFNISSITKHCIKKYYTILLNNPVG